MKIGFLPQCSLNLFPKIFAEHWCSLRGFLFCFALFCKAFAGKSSLAELLPASAGGLTLLTQHSRQKLHCSLPVVRPDLDVSKSDSPVTGCRPSRSLVAVDACEVPWTPICKQPAPPRAGMSSTPPTERVNILNDGRFGGPKYCIFDNPHVYPNCFPKSPPSIGAPSGGKHHEWLTLSGSSLMYLRPTSQMFT